MDRWFLHVILAFSLAIPLAGCGEEEAPPPPVVRPVKILELGGSDDAQVLEFPGTVKAGRHAELAFEVSGKLESLSVTEGQPVSEGDVLAALDDRDFQAKLDAERAKERAAEAEYQRTKALFDENVTSKQQLDTKLRNYEVTTTSVARARKALEDAELRAPFDGKVARVDVDNFENVQAKQTILVVENDSRFEVEADIPEQDAARMPPGLTLEQRSDRIRADIVIGALEGRRFPARLTEFASTADPKTRTFAATLAFDNPGDVSLATGMTATVRVHVSKEVVGKAGLFVPAVAVGSRADGEALVWVIDPSSMEATARSVELGAMAGDRVRVTSGLTGSEWIATSGISFLYEGMVVSRATE